jgi:hypothetical protein
VSRRRTPSASVPLEHPVSRRSTVTIRLQVDDVVHDFAEQRDVIQ